MTTSRDSRREQVERFRRLIREHEERIARRDRVAFEGALAALMQRVSTRPPPPQPTPPPPPAPSPPPPVSRPSETRPDVWWSNTPVLGYRIWDLKNGRLHGAWTPWETSRKSAVCLDKQSSARGPVPHDAADCRPPPCGIYALKGTRKVQRMVERSILKTAVPMTLAIGLVAMTGRVVEHEHGYRAEHVEVISLAMVTGAVGKQTVLTRIEGREAVADAFLNPRAARSRQLDPDPTTPKDAVARALRFLREQEMVEAG